MIGACIFMPKKILRFDFDGLTHTKQLLNLLCIFIGSEGQTVYATVRSDCTGPLEGVKFTSTELIGVTSNLPGSYRLRVCTLPTDITSQKHGYEPVTQRVTQTSLSIQLTCPGKCLSRF